MVGTGLVSRMLRSAPLACALTALTVIFGASASASAGTLPVAVDFWGMTPDAVSIKPHQLVWATDVSQPNFGGTSNANSALQWSSWTATSASGSGALWVPKLLPPNGSKVSFTPYPVELSYSAPETLTLGTTLSATGAPYKTASVFSTLKVTFTGAVPAHWSQSASFHIKSYPAAKGYKGFYGFAFPT